MDKNKNKLCQRYGKGSGKGAGVTHEVKRFTLPRLTNNRPSEALDGGRTGKPLLSCQVAGVKRLRRTCARFLQQHSVLLLWHGTPGHSERPLPLVAHQNTAKSICQAAISLQVCLQPSLFTSLDYCDFSLDTRMINLPRAGVSAGATGWIVCVQGRDGQPQRR